MFVVGWWRNQDAGGLWPEWVNPWAGVGPAVLALVFVWLVWRRVLTLGRGRRVGEKIARYGALWLSLYSCAWLFGQKYTREGLILGVLTLVGFLGMTVLREVFAIVEQPMDYRR